MLLEALKALDQEARLPHFYALQHIGYRIDPAPMPVVASFLFGGQSGRSSAPDPDITRTSKAVPLPVDRGDYGTRNPAKGKTQQSADERHVLWEALLDELFAATGVAEVATVKTFAASVNHHPVSIPEGFDSSRFIVIYVNGVFFADDERVRSWWRDRQLSGASATADTSAQCSVCGKLAPVVENVTTQVRGLSGIGGKSKMALVSGNVDVFERHGLSRASGASICASCGEATHQALNRLISDPIRSRNSGPQGFCGGPPSRQMTSSERCLKVTARTLSARCSTHYCPAARCRPSRPPASMPCPSERTSTASWSEAGST